MTINCVWEHNGRDTLLYAVDFVGAYTRGETLEAAVRKMQAEICSYLKWCGKKAVTSMDIVIIEEKVSELAICDADSDVLFESEKAPLTAEEYIKLKALALKSAQDFLALYDSVPDKNATAAPERKTFYGQVPRTANEMYEHTPAGKRDGDLSPYFRSGRSYGRKPDARRFIQYFAACLCRFAALDRCYICRRIRSGSKKAILLKGKTYETIELFITRYSACFFSLCLPAGRSIFRRGSRPTGHYGRSNRIL